MSQFTPIGQGREAAARPSSERKIDYDRPGGVIIKFITDLGMEVFMYRAEPGVYLSAHGTEVPEVLAKRAGFDTERLGKLREHSRLVAQATEVYAKQLDINETKASKTVIAERDGFQVVLIGGVRYGVFSPDGMELTKGMPLTEAVALELLDQLAGTPPPVDGAGDSGGERAARGGVRSK